MKVEEMPEQLGTHDRQYRPEQLLARDFTMRKRIFRIYEGK
jgi:hypothetical protein